MNLEFTVTILYHLFILNKYLTFPICNRNKYDKKVTDYMNVHNPAYVFRICPKEFSRNGLNCKVKSWFGRSSKLKIDHTQISNKIPQTYKKHNITDWFSLFPN